MCQTVLLEAMWAGLPCSATDVGGFADALSTDVGVLCDVESTTGIARAITEVVTADPQVRLDMAHRARRLVKR